VTAPDDWRATYRIQITADFTFQAATAAVPYLRDLGISHVYLSPVLEAVTGSTHGYDGTDPTRVSAERGGEDGLRALADAVHEAGMGLLVDIVPNHLAVSDETPWWRDPDERARMFDYDPSTGWYRRFFDIDGLVGLRQEDPEVFERSHAKILELVRDGLIDGLRIDHPDGLADPAGYLARLHDEAAVPIWVEKILAPTEPLRPWPVAGTVGYEFADDATAVFVDPSGEAALTAAYTELTGDDRDFEEVALACKREELDGAFTRELDRLVDLAGDVERDALAETIAHFPIYRTYVVPARAEVADADVQAVFAASAPPGLARALLLATPGHDELITRFQQTTAPVVAKGVEDTALYRSVRLIARNEVGVEPSRFSLPIDAFHARNLDRAGRTPMGLLAATTHDTKRSADTRARIGALASMADEYAVAVRRWFVLAGAATAAAGLADGPSPREWWYLFQTLLGSWPIADDRLHEHMLKAMREARLTTNWAEPDEAHEAAVLTAYRALAALPAFDAEFVPFAERVANAGEWASVGQALLRATSPGVCDTFQGDETWFLSLVDPDNRRPLDWERRRAQLDQVRSGAAPNRDNAKLHALHHALDLRRRLPGPFAGPYRALEAGGSTIAFTRGAHDDVLVVVAVRPDPSAVVDVPSGAWLDAPGAGGPVGGAERPLSGRVPVADLIGPLHCGLWERR
jgi:(1->4)-alpha-D-glucan 1-alpha-D-glucosylmutase